MSNEVAVEKVLFEDYRMPNPDGEYFHDLHSGNCPKALLGHKVQCPERLYGIMKQCWARDPKVRPTFESLNIMFDNYEQLGT